MLCRLQKIGLLFLCWAAGASLANAQSHGNLVYFLKQARQNNYSLKSQEALAAGQGYLKAKAGAAWYPTMAAEASRVHDLPITDRNWARSTDSFQLTLGVNQPLYDEKLPRTYERETVASKRAKAQLEDMTERLFYETGLTFFTMAQYQAEFAQRTQQLALQLEEESTIQRRIRLGDLNLTNASQIQAQIERSRANLALLQSKIAEQRLKLAQLCLCQVPESVKLPAESLWTKALETQAGIPQSLLNVSRLDIEVAQADLRVIQAKSRPTLNLEGLVYRDVMNAYQGVRSSFALNLSWPLDVARVTHYESSQALSFLQAARFNLQLQESDLETNQQMARDRLRILLDARKYFAAALSSAQQHFQHTKRQFAEGANTQSELFLAQNDLFQAESELLSQTFESWLTYWNLSFYRGNLAKILQEAGEGG